MILLYCSDRIAAFIFANSSGFTQQPRLNHSGDDSKISSTFEGVFGNGANTGSNFEIAVPE